MSSLGKDRKRIKNLLKCHKNSAETLRSDPFSYSKGIFARLEKSAERPRVEGFCTK